MAKTAKNITELANWLDLSVTTVSRVFNGKAEQYRISEATCKKVLDAAKKYNYYPNKLARGLKLEKSETLGLIIPDIANPFFASIGKIIETESRKHGYSIILSDSLDNDSSEEDLLLLLAGRKVDGIILAPVGKKYGHIIALQQKGIPIVVIDRYFPDIQIPYITTDNYSGAFEAVEYFIQQGHKKIACIQGIRGISTNTDRVKGYKDALKKYHIPVDNNLIVGNNFSIENGYAQTRKLFEQEKQFTAILSLSNLSALGVIQALSEKGLDIPNDISLISFDEQPYSAYLACPMTTIKQRGEEIATMAVHTLIEMINNKNDRNNTSIKLKPGFIIRDSVKHNDVN